jgi:dTMP kinase
VLFFFSFMPKPNKFIALEGIDGSGKRTQIDMLSRALSARGVPHATISFPHYEGFFGRLVARYLNGQFGRLADVDPHLSALLFAGDRFESRGQIEAHLAAGRMVIADRYVGSNLAHQTARVPAPQRKPFLKWLQQLEYEVYGLPAEDLVILLRVPVEQAHRMVGRKKTRSYTKRRRDLQEADIGHLRRAALVYDWLARQPNWARIDCTTARSLRLLPPEAIHLRIMDFLQSRKYL